MRFRSCLAFVLLLLGKSGYTQSQDALLFSNQINEDSLRNYVFQLASDEFEGRETGHQGLELAAEYVADHFRKSGVKPYPGKDYFQEYPLRILYPEGVNIRAGAKTFEFLKDFYYFPGFEDTVISKRNLLFLGYGINEGPYQSFKDTTALKDQVLLFFEGEPTKKGHSLISGTPFSPWTRDWKKKFVSLKKYKPAAFLVIVDDLEKNVKALKSKIETPTLRSGESKKGKETPYFYISREMAAKLLGTNLKGLEKLKESLNDSILSSLPVSERKVSLQLNVIRNTEHLSSKNVIGYIEGDNTEETVVVSAHMDHLGKRDAQIFYGADDDASGTAAVMELARVMQHASENIKPKRNILFITFSGEEKGLLGSSYYTTHPFVPMRKTVADLNIDMIGRVDEKHENNGNYVYVIGNSEQSKQLYKINEEVNKKTVNLEIDYTFNEPDDPNRFYYRSDHYNFARFGVPVLFYFNGTHIDYHQVSDTPDKILFDLLRKRTELVFLNLWKIAFEGEKTR